MEENIRLKVGPPKTPTTPTSPLPVIKEPVDRKGATENNEVMAEMYAQVDYSKASLPDFFFFFFFFFFLSSFFCLFVCFVLLFSYLSLVKFILIFFLEEESLLNGGISSKLTLVLR